jgi:hypothetical protein
MVFGYTEGASSTIANWCVVCVRGPSLRSDKRASKDGPKKFTSSILVTEWGHGVVMLEYTIQKCYHVVALLQCVQMSIGWSHTDHWFRSYRFHVSCASPLISWKWWKVGFRTLPCEGVVVRCPCLAQNDRQWPVAHKILFTRTSTGNRWRIRVNLVILNFWILWDFDLFELIHPGDRIQWRIACVHRAVLNFS